MQLINARTDGAERERVAVSPVVELNWVLASLKEPHRFANDTLSMLFADDAVAADVRGIWGSAPSCFPELLLLAARAGVLEHDVADALPLIEAASARRPGALALRTEEPEERAEIIDRLDRLATDETLRQRYFAVLAAVWALVGPEWERKGRPLVEAAVAELSRARGPLPTASPHASSSTSWREVMRSSCREIDLWIDQVDSWIGPGDEVLIAPAYFSGNALLLDVPGVLIAGPKIPTAAGDRIRFEELGRRLKSVADPTRLAILARASEGPVLVGELATELGLAQPTVSNHVKLLRSAGLLVERRDGGRRCLVLDRDALEGVSTLLIDGVVGV
jgi:DNA-binding transcriptional ArsR family regulator